MVTDWLLPTDKEILLWLSEMAETVPDCTVTFKVVQSDDVPTAQIVSDDEPRPCPVTVTCVPFVVTLTIVGFEFPVI